ncbi:UbiA family prenyltransferase [Aeromicrobium sp. NPDC092404]|uniref:UbiA family prenyltransferase n=1 Tax=Aeromicrobium sp. NPDC092404 TaxID=3154976 RepID=UPI0034417546
MTTLAVLLAVAMEATPATVALTAIAAFTGQLSVGWSNDLIDRDRDRIAGRTDKPLATGVLRPETVRVAIALALAATAVASLSLGLRAGLLHLGLVSLGWAYNGWLKKTVGSFLPYAVCFGCLPIVVSLAAGEGMSPAWMPVAGALLGVGAHLINAVPDLADDERTGVQGLPHRLGARRSLDLATALMLAGSAATVLGPDRRIDVADGLTLALVVGLAIAGRLGRGPAAFRAALAIALVDVVALLVRT